MKRALVLVRIAVTTALFWAINRPLALAETLILPSTTQTTINVSYPTARNLPSDVWRPAILTACFPGLHNETAPCRRVPNLLYAEELLYQDFRIRLPHFVDPDHKRIYLKVIHHYRHFWRRGRIIGEHGYFLNQRGQNLVYGSVLYNGTPAPGKWTDDACMSHGADRHAGAAAFPAWDAGLGDTSDGDDEGQQALPCAVFAASPDDWSFQHFTDRVMLLLAQTHHLTAHHVPGGWRYIVSQKPRVDTVQQLWHMLVPGLNSSEASLLPASADSKIRTRLLLYPCQTPLVHPYTHQLASELIQQAAGFDPRVVEPIASRPVVLFFARGGSRAWVNQDQCRMALQFLIQDRNRGEQFLTFRREDYPTVRDVVALGRRVKLVVGVHGGALNNIILLQPGTAVVEVCPVARDHRSFRCGLMFWEAASVRHMQYWSVPATDVTPDWQINHLECGLVVTAVRQALEGLGTLSSPLEPFHQGSKFP